MVSPTPPDFFAENANKSEHHAESAYCSDHIVDANKMVSAGLPSEEAFQRLLFEFATCTDLAAGPSALDANARSFASAILDLIRPAFEAVAADRDAWKAEKQRETNRAMAEINDLHAEADRLAAARDAAEAKLAQAVGVAEELRQVCFNRGALLDEIGVKVWEPAAERLSIRAQIAAPGAAMENA